MEVTVQKELKEALNILCPYITENDGKFIRMHLDKEWLKIMNNWVYSVIYGLNPKPLFLVADNIEMCVKLYTWICFELAKTRKIVFITTSEEMRENKPLEPFVAADEKYGELQANLIVLMDAFKRHESYDDIIARFNGRRTNLLVFCHPLSEKFVEGKENVLVLKSKPRMTPFNDEEFKKFIADFNKETEPHQKDLNMAVIKFQRPQPLVIKSIDKDKISKWYDRHFDRLDSEPWKNFELKRQPMRRLDVSLERLETWEKDEESMKKDMIEQNLIVFNFNRLDISKIMKIEEKLRELDPSGSCLIVYIIPKNCKAEVPVEYTNKFYRV